MAMTTAATKATGWGRYSDGMLVRYLEEAEGYARAGVEGYAEDAAAIRAELAHRVAR